jgi:DUF2075 family protein
LIVYQSTKSGFLEDTFGNDIQTIIHDAYQKRLGKRVSPSEVQSWKESLVALAKVLRHESIPDECGVAVEYGIPQSGKRIDVLLSGRDESDRENLLIVELKQWDEFTSTRKDGVVRARFRGGIADTSHPSYQAWSYAELLRNFNEALHSDEINVQPCAYLHNFVSGAAASDPFYADYVSKAPMFMSGVAERELLRAFISRHVRRGDRGQLIVRIEDGRIRPSRRLIDALLGMLEGKREFVLIDDQKVVFETVMAHAVAAEQEGKRVIIIEGGPGTGKSVVAINLLAALTGRNLLTKYVTKNAAPRAVFEKTLSGSYRRSRIASLFAGSGEFIETPEDTFDALIVDEAHRLNAKSGLYSNLGNNQIAEIIRASRCAVFFIDEDQRVTWKDIGRKSEIQMWAREFGIKGDDVVHLKLESQFRCSGSDGYLAWLDDVLGIRETAHRTLDPAEFDFRVLDSPTEVRRLIEEKNKVANRARMVAGYCWPWNSKKDPNAFDVVIPEHGFEMRWNLTEDGGLWITADDSVEQIGCIHTCQGLEVDYIGVIVGPDLLVRDGVVVTQPGERASQDQSIKGYKKEMEENPDAARKKVDAIIKNTYRTLMTRGMKGCFLYCTDVETASYLRGRIGYPASVQSPADLLRRVADDRSDPRI